MGGENEASDYRGHEAGAGDEEKVGNEEVEEDKGRKKKESRDGITKCVTLGWGK